MIRKVGYHRKRKKDKIFHCILSSLFSFSNRDKFYRVIKAMVGNVLQVKRETLTNLRWNHQ